MIREDISDFFICTTIVICIATFLVNDFNKKVDAIICKDDKGTLHADYIGNPINKKIDKRKCKIKRGMKNHELLKEKRKVKNHGK